jgi:hypothetical protein
MRHPPHVGRFRGWTRPCTRSYRAPPAQLGAMPDVEGSRWAHRAPPLVIHSPSTRPVPSARAVAARDACSPLSREIQARCRRVRSSRSCAGQGRVRPAQQKQERPAETSDVVNRPAHRRRTVRTARLRGRPPRPRRPARRPAPPGRSARARGATTGPPARARPTSRRPSRQRTVAVPQRAGLAAAAPARRRGRRCR